MNDRIPCEFFLIRYVPDVVKGEFVNIGVLLREAVSESPRTRVQFTRDWTRVRCVDAGADLALLEDLEQEIVNRLRTGPGVSELLACLEASLSNSIQITEPRATLAENLTTGIEQLLRLYVEPLQVARPKSARKPTGRPAILASMRSEFERAGVWSAMNKRLPVEPYTRRGDPLRIDCGYKKEAKSSLNSSIRMFQAVSLEGDLEMAKLLAFAAPQLRDGVARVENAEVELTAIIEPLRLIGEEGEATDRYYFGRHIMEDLQINVRTMSELAAIAQTAQRELGM